MNNKKVVIQPPKNPIKKKRRTNLGNITPLPSKNNISPKRTHAITMPTKSLGAFSLSKDSPPIAPNYDNVLCPPPPESIKDVLMVPILMLPNKDVDYLDLIASAEKGGMAYGLFTDRAVTTDREVIKVQGATEKDMIRMLFLSSQSPFVMVMRSPVKGQKWLYKGISELIGTKKTTILYKRGCDVSGSSMILNQQGFVTYDGFNQWGWDWVQNLIIK